MYIKIYDNRKKMLVFKITSIKEQDMGILIEGIKDFIFFNKNGKINNHKKLYDYFMFKGECYTNDRESYNLFYSFLKKI